MINLGERSRKARAATLFAKVLMHDKQERIIKVLLPGSEGKQYEVILRRNGHLSGECNLRIGLLDMKPCEGNQHAVCYHVLAAVLIAAEAGEAQVSFCQTQADADALSHIGRKVYQVRSWNCDAVLWLSVKGQHAELYDPLPDFSSVNNVTKELQHQRDLAALYGED